MIEGLFSHTFLVLHHPCSCSPFVGAVAVGSTVGMVCITRRSTMYARVVSAQAQSNKLDHAIEICQSMEPAWQQQKGFQGANLLVNRETGTILSISTWASRADLEATEASGWYQEQVAKFSKIWVQPPVREIFEIAVHIGVAQAVGGASA
jgi:quinol monooxygenase YgiN